MDEDAQTRPDLEERVSTAKDTKFTKQNHYIILPGYNPLQVEAPKPGSPLRSYLLETGIDTNSYLL